MLILSKLFVLQLTYEEMSSSAEALAAEYEKDGGPVRARSKKIGSERLYSQDNLATDGGKRAKGDRAEHKHQHDETRKVIWCFILVIDCFTIVFDRL